MSSFPIKTASLHLFFLITFISLLEKKGLCGAQGTTCRNRFSPYTVAHPRNKTWALSLLRKCLSLLNHFLLSLGCTLISYPRNFSSVGFLNQARINGVKLVFLRGRNLIKQNLYAVHAAEGSDRPYPVSHGQQRPPASPYHAVLLRFCCLSLPPQQGAGSTTRPLSAGSLCSLEQKLQGSTMRHGEAHKPSPPRTYTEWIL